MFSGPVAEFLVLKKLSPRGAFRVFDPHAGPAGDYRMLYRLPHSQATRQKIETLLRKTGPTANRNFPPSAAARIGDGKV